MDRCPRIVLDTNVLISAVLKQGPSIPNSIYQAFKNQKFVLLTSPGIMEEVEEVINREEIVSRTKMTRETRKRFVENLLETSMITGDRMKVEVVKNDPDDDKFVACAVEGQADFIVSGDRHLLELKGYKGIKIISPREFADWLEERGGA